MSFSRRVRRRAESAARTTQPARSGGVRGIQLHELREEEAEIKQLDSVLTEGWLRIDATRRRAATHPARAASGSAPQP